MSLLNNKVQCNDGTFDITNGAVAPCFNRGGVKLLKSKYSGISEFLNDKSTIFPSFNIIKPSVISNDKVISLQEEKEKLALEKAKTSASEPVKKSMTLTHIGLFIGGLAVGYFAYKKFKK